MNSAGQLGESRASPLFPGAGAGVGAGETEPRKEPEQHQTARVISLPRRSRPYIDGTGVERMG
jgi:hypothetical protein